MDIRFVNTTNTASKKQGFTLVELLVVIAIIGIIAAIGLTNLLESREQSENAAVISQVYEYQKALELSFAESGRYPDSGINSDQRDRILCMGDSAPGTCLNGHSNGVVVRSIDNDVQEDKLKDAIDPYMPSQPHILQPKGGLNFSSPAYSGCTDFVNPNYPEDTGGSCTTSDYSIWFVLKGTNEDCGRATLADPEFEGVYTLCRLQEE